jgi:hypothetical protein
VLPVTGAVLVVLGVVDLVRSDDEPDPSAMGQAAAVVAAEYRRQLGPAGRGLQSAALPRATILSALIGGTFFLHGVVVSILAFTMPTGTHLALARPIGLPILLVGVAMMFAYGRRSAAKLSSVSVSGPEKSR